MYILVSILKVNNATGIFKGNLGVSIGLEF